MIVFHQLSKDSLSNVLRYGLKQLDESQRENNAIRRTDLLLNEHRPRTLVDAGVNRIKNVYCYLYDGAHIIDITNGKKVLPTGALDDSSQIFIKLDIDETKSYVSDLDKYDHVMQCVNQKQNIDVHVLIHDYWASLQSLASYDGSIARPEVIVTYDIPPSSILATISH